MSDTIDLKEAEKRIEELIENVLEKLPPVKAVEITQKLALYTAMSALRPLPSEEIIHHLNILHDSNVAFAIQALETLEGMDNE